MLRFQKNSSSWKSDTRKITGRDRFRLWLLVLMLGLVLLAMRRLQHPDTLRGMEEFFGLSPAASSGGAGEDASETPILLSTPVASGERLGEGETRERLEPPSPGPSMQGRGTSEAEPDTSAGDSELAPLLQRIEDNAAFRPEEQPAWFALFAQLQQQTASQLREQTAGEITYAQLVQQPDVYRGRVVGTLHGTVERTERLTAPDNSLGIDAYDRLWLQPAGGGEWHFVVYCLTLPEDFPQGDRSRVRVKVTGYFFKVWSYAYDDGFGLAPVVLAAEVEWNPNDRQASKTTEAARQKPVSVVQVLLAIAAVALVAAIISLVLWRRTQRRDLPRLGRLTKEAESHVGDDIGEAFRLSSEPEHEE